MRRRPWRRGIASFAIVSSIAVPMLNNSETLAQNRADSTKGAASPAVQLPANYRQLMAQYIRAHNRYVIRDALITKPYERYGGLFRGGSIPTVCVAIFRDNPFGIVVRDNWVMTIENGQVKPMAIGLETCSDLSPFTELKQR